MVVTAVVEDGRLLPCDPDEDRATALDVPAARLHHRVRAALQELLEAALPTGYDVTAGCAWHLGGPSEQVLHPDVVVHRPLGPDGRLRAAPVLCVQLAPVSGADQAVQRLARHGVDHGWLIDLDARTVEVLVRTGDRFRHAETVRSTPTWVDFGVGLVRIDLVGLLGTSVVTGAAGDAGPGRVRPQPW